MWLPFLSWFVLIKWVALSFEGRVRRGPARGPWVVGGSGRPRPPAHGRASRASRACGGFHAIDWRRRPIAGAGAWLARGAREAARRSDAQPSAEALAVELREAARELPGLFALGDLLVG